MANRMFDRVIIIDSAMGNFSCIGGTSANITEFSVNAIAFWSATSSGNCVLTGANTATDVIIQFSFHPGSGNVIGSTQFLPFASPQRFNAIKCPTFSGGSAWIYLA